MRALRASARLNDDPGRTLPVVVNELAERFGDAPALIGETESFTFRALAARMNQVSRWALDDGVGAGDIVALMMQNRPEYFAIWLGIVQIGGVVALLNINLTGRSLAHCAGVAKPSRVIVADRYAEVWREAAARLEEPPRCFTHGGAGSIDDDWSARDGAPLAEFQPPVLSDRALLIYTSGTTGLPKAAHVSHHRIMSWSVWFAALADTGPGDRMYDCLPMYHSVGGVVAIGAVLVNGGSVVIRERFSAREFWGDVVRHGCTMAQYIGELCRYLLSAPQDPNECAHRLRIVCGNGLRADVWPKFQQRFAIPRVLEFYAATEGTFSLYNVEGQVGAIGRVPSFMRARSPVALIRVDPATRQPIRGPDGFCVRCAVNETGEAIGRLGDDATARFEGYTNEADSEMKMLRDVFRAGDAYARTGDLMRCDARGFFAFVDRLGDTFRWKGENVAALEVASTLTSCRGVVDAAVYGVEVPGLEGRAGMALLATEGPLDLDAVAEALKALPPYARPLFLRHGAAIDVTATFKHQKQGLIEDGFDPARISDPLFAFDAAAGAFVPLDAALHARIVAGQIRL